MGLINTDPQVKLNATFALTNPAHGNYFFHFPKSGHLVWASWNMPKA